MRSGGPTPAKALGPEHLPDAVTIVTMLHFLPGAREEERLNVKRGGRGAGRASFGPSLGNRQPIMCLHTLTVKTASPSIVLHKGTMLAPRAAR